MGSLKKKVLPQLPKDISDNTSIQNIKTVECIQMRMLDLNQELNRFIIVTQ
jgi:hypothetical protein